ncbi:MAG TPA: DeoR/GlpR family DNA-binding transcription regulator [Terriglobia bacterium]|nr:DeoR/GlpR family DNA-binding transcription regulator [Terriglobia bacterium]
MASKNDIAAREQWILDQLLRQGSITIEEICKEAGVSLATARRDLRQLEQQGRLRRNYGGAVSIEPLLYEQFRHASSYREQIEKHADEKRRIALAAARLIEDGDTIVLTSGTTTNQVARSIPAGREVTVVTGTVNVAMELTNRRGVSVFVTGGLLHGEWFSLVGPAAMHSLSSIFPDKVFIGANGIHASHGVTAYHPDEAALNSFMVRQSRQKIVVVDHSKLGAVATHLICPIDQISLIITDTEATPEAVAEFTNKGIEVRQV